MRIIVRDDDLYVMILKRDQLYGDLTYQDWPELMENAGLWLKSVSKVRIN
jgi:hypothetical protein